MFYKSKYFQAEQEENFLILTIASKENPLNNLSDDFSDRFEECILNATKAPMAPPITKNNNT